MSSTASNLLLAFLLLAANAFYVAAEFALVKSRGFRIRAMVEQDPSRAVEQPYKAIVENDRTWLASVTENSVDLLNGLAAAYAGFTVDAFEQAVQDFFAATTHPTWGVPYTKLGYEPMRELVGLLLASDFRVFVCSGGGRDFMRAVSDRLYGIPRERVIGSAASLDAALKARGFEPLIDRTEICAFEDGPLENGPLEVCSF